MWPGSRAVMWTRPGDDATTSRCLCAQLSRRRQGQTRATGQSVRTARGGDHRDRGGVGGSDDGARRDGVHDHPLAAARSCRGGDGDGAEAGLARAAGRGRPPAGSGGGADRVAGRAARSKLSTAAWWPNTTLGADLGVASASADEVYAAMDWLANRQDKIEKQLAARHLGAEANPARMALFDLSSSWMEGRSCRWPRAAPPRRSRKATRGSSTGSSPIPRGGWWRCGCFPATPPIHRLRRGAHRCPGHVRAAADRDGG